MSISGSSVSQQNYSARQFGIDRAPSIFWRSFLIVCLGILQALVLSVAYDPPAVHQTPSLALQLVLSFAGDLAHIAVLTVAGFALLNWSQRKALLGTWRSSLRSHPFSLWLALNATLFLATIMASLVLSSSAQIYTQWIAPYFALLAILGLSLMLTAAPVLFWRTLLAETWVSLVLAFVAAVLVFLISLLAEFGWVPLAGATLNASYAILSLYESNVVMNVTTQELGVGDFLVQIAPECSGYEGIGLVTAVLGLYLAVFRKQLAFPNAFFLLPAGILAIWLFNAVRIAALVSLGAHFSPKMAVGGFHSQAGWIAFILVTVGVMMAGHNLSIFQKRKGQDKSDKSAPAASAQPGEEIDALAWLAPFIGLMAASIVASAFAPNDQWLYGLRVAAVGAALWMFRGVYWPLVTRVSWLSIGAGLAVGAAWIATDPDPAAGAKLGTWLAGLPVWLMIAWLAVRAAGTIIFVPIAEELAFRGYLYNLLKSPALTRLAPVLVTVAAVAVTSILFGAIHQRWLAGALAGLVYALVMIRSGRISDPIGAHMASNAIIFGWALFYGQWSLL